jgi:hypothetical protein
VAVKELEIEKIQRMAVRIVATNPAGHNLLLIGGFRYRLLDRSARFSGDIDYHWEGDLGGKQAELLRLSRRTVVPQVRRELGYGGTADIPTGPEAESPNARFVELRFWKLGVAASQIVVPLEITRIICLDPATIRTAEGIVYPTPSDTDLIEGKIVAVLNRLVLAHRDLVDIFLYGDRLRADSPRRLQEKLEKLHVDPASVRRRLDDLGQNVEYHSRTVQAILDSQLDPVVAAQINAGGGGKTVFSRALQFVQSHVRL